MPVPGPGKLALVQSPGCQPNAKAVMHQYLDAVASLVGKQIGVMGLGFAELPDDTRQRRIRAGAHVHGLRRQPDLVDMNHDCNKRNQSMARSICVNGQCALI